MHPVNNPPPYPPGFLVLDKPRNMSSMKAVAIVRKKAGGLKTGHAGTLDPLATGVLVVALGRATKSISLVMDTTKKYQTVIDLSAYTTTDDREGERTEIDVDEIPSESDVLHALDSFRGESMQRPPAFSAIKVSGRRAYKLARGGDAPDLNPRPVTAHEVELVRYAWPEVEIELHVEKGFYVRSLARDLGDTLSTGGHCASIRRTAVGPFTLEGALDPEQLPDPLPAGCILDIDSVLHMLDF
jgi:tRNA pseudouridine55 synthase